MPSTGRKGDRANWVAQIRSCMFEGFMRGERERWAAVVKTLGVTAE